MKRLILLCTIAIFYLAACTNSSDAHTHEDGTTHTHEPEVNHSHDDEGSHTHADGTTHTHEDGTTHSHEQEEFSVEADSLKQDSVQDQHQ